MNARRLRRYRLTLVLASVVLLAVAPMGAVGQHTPVQRVSWSDVATIDLADFNKDLVAGRPTMDVAIYIPSNFDPAFNKLTLEQMLSSVRSAKEIYGRVGVQINLLSVRTGAIDPRFLAIQSNEIPRLPDTEYLNTYEASQRHPTVMTDMAKAAFESIVEPFADNRRTIYLVALQDVIYPYLELSEGRNWTVKMVRTGGLSFSSYSYHTTIPDRLRGVITITNLSTPGRLRRTVAHELGHKVMNVSHEYKTTAPAFEVHAAGGLMLYGDGEDIPAGADGRWHLERLLLSPYIYKLDAEGRKVWNPDYREGGHYYDPIYGEKAVRFPGRIAMDPDW
jgi:hypothetical protein